MAATSVRAPWATQRVDTVNIGLLLLAFAAAIVLPFEVFLFSYAVLGPLHYLTEISWLHDKKYYATGTYDVLVLVVLSLLITIFFFVQQEVEGAQWIRDNIGFERYRELQAHVIFVALASAAIFAFVKDIWYKVIGIGVLLTLTFVSSRMVVLLGVFVPTLIHVFVFTSLFMLYGALKSNSRPGLIAVAVHLVLAVILLFMLGSVPSVDPSSYGASAYTEGFSGVNQAIFEFDYFRGRSYAAVTESLDKPRNELTFVDLIFNSAEGIGIMRFIAFAYTYHYLNWFSKTEIIRWHQVPRSRFVVVIIGAIASIALYAIDYSLGFKWLFLLSFMHVMLEFPLNWITATGIFKELSQRLTETTTPNSHPEPKVRTPSAPP